MNKAIICGNLGQDPEGFETESGTTIANFSVATSSYGKDGDGNRVEYVEWHRIVAFGKTAENCLEYLGKGKKVLVEGSLRTREWEDKKHEGVKHYTTEVVADRVQFLSAKES